MEDQITYRSLDI